MSLAPETRYSDRDVREDENLTHLAIAYLKAYRGDFEPLTDAQQMLARDGELPVAIVRKVLNCMRHDRDWAHRMPPPVSPPVFLPPSFTGGRRKNYRRRGQCDNPQPHSGPHDFTDGEYDYTCPGQPYAINRTQEVKMPVKIKADFVFALTVSGRLIHRLDPDAQHYATWFPNRHDWGWNTQWIKHNADAGLTVRTLCKNPGRIRYPILLTTLQAEDYVGEPTAFSNEFIGWCDRCETIFRMKSL